MIAKIGRITLRVFILVLLLLIIIDLVLGRVVNFRMDDSGLKSFFHDRKMEPHIGYYQSRGRQVRYLEVGDQQKATVLFIHGAPSSLSYWKGYLSDSSLLDRASLYAVDRPGYGYSGLGDPLPDIATQASILKLVLDSLHKAHHPIVVVGVSFGAPIASRLAMDYPDLVDGLVLLAPPLGPGLERIFWFTYLVENPLINWLVPPMLKSANREKVHHREELTKMLPLWSRIHVPVIYLQGMEDGLVSPSNAGFAKAHLVNASSLDIRMIPGRGHLIAFNEKDRIAGAIREMLDRCMKKPQIPPTLF
ncbi:MAG TPA: alpha/beta hydrolase [Puia sp.]|jgi:pimeloyl-ACP methyl ester carboxylesterase|nr:alpha/beta hydrolase [Puia sp.]